MGRINGLGVYEPASAKPFPILHKMKASSVTPSIPSIHWTALPMRTNLQPLRPLPVPKRISRPESTKQKSLPKSLAKSAMEWLKRRPHGFGHVQMASRPALQAATPTTEPTPAVVTSPGPITTGYVATTEYDPSDTTCSSVETNNILIPLGTCILGGIMYTADVSILYLFCFSFFATCLILFLFFSFFSRVNMVFTCHNIRIGNAKPLQYRVSRSLPQASVLNVMLSMVALITLFMYPTYLFHHSELIQFTSKSQSFKT